MDDQFNLDLGPCCHCEKTGPAVRNIMMLHRRAPVPGTGWGCFQCGLSQDGAVAVLCDECLEASKPKRFVCVGQPGDGKRMPVEELSTEPFDHDMSKHPEEARLPDDQLPTTERLARALEALDDPRLLDMIARARAGYYDDFKSILSLPLLQLIRDLEAAGHPEMTRRVRNGEFDATDAEADVWMRSPEAKEIITHLVQLL